MTDPDFDDASYDEVRSLLADAGAPARLPADVAASLDATLAGLVAERAAEDDPAVVPLRRRLPAQRFLVAAAAVVLLGAGGIGLSQVLGGSGAGQADSTASSATAEDAGVAPLVPQAPAAPEVGGVPAPEPVAGGTADGLREDSGRFSYDDQLKRLAEQSFTTAGFERQVTRFLDPGPGVTVVSPQSGELANLSDATKAGGQCPGPEVTTGGTALRITFDEAPAVLVLHPVVDGTRYVAAWSCDGTRLLAYTTVPG